MTPHPVTPKIQRLADIVRRRAPSVLATSRSMIADKGRAGLPTWSDAVGLPIAGTVSALANAWAAGEDVIGMLEVFQGGEAPDAERGRRLADQSATPPLVPLLEVSAGYVNAATLWHYLKASYVVDPWLGAQLERMGARGWRDIPCAALAELPCWGQLVTCGPNEYFIWLEQDMDDQSLEFRTLTWLEQDMDDPMGLSAVLHLPSGGTLGEGWEMANQRIADRLGGIGAGRVLNPARLLEACVPLALALTDRGLGAEPTPPAYKPAGKKQRRAGGGERQLVARPTPLVHHVGAGLRERVEAEPAGGTDAEGRQRPRAHVRAGHVHLYWTGPRNEPKPVFRWVKPTLVKGRVD